MLRRQALKEELLWLALFAVAVLGAVAGGLDAVMALAMGLAVYAAWHLAQAWRLLAFILRDRDPGGWAWGLWRDVFHQVRWIKRRERSRKRRQKRFFSRFRKVASSMPDGVVILGNRGEVSWLNRQAEVYFGLVSGEAVGRRLVDQVDHPVLREYLESGNFRQLLEIEAPGDRSLVLSISVTRFKKGPQRFLLVVRDITRLYHLNRSQRDFTLNVSHELRTPLTVLHGYLETLFDSTDEQAAQRVPLLRMMDQTRRMQTVIQDLSMLSQLEDGSQTVQREPVAVLEMLQDIVDEGRELARETHHVLELGGEPGLMLLGDESLLRCAFSNLIFNAIRHTPGRTEVRITWGRDGDRAALEVRDNGAGIPARHLPRLTERFYRVDAGRSRDAGGTGLGLAIVRQVLTVHDATLSIRSDEGRGCSFTCHFPAERYRAVDELLNGAEA
ncbi:MAG: phosphate regulon sensor histidine kinase PhoR [Chromatiaceae bacterium]|nr:phosphate regulon sensor histidine kinase PhoR [Chromatiaceae bacterium]